MNRMCATAAALLMLGGFSMAQGSVGGGSGGASSSPGTAPGSSGSSSQGTTGLGTGANDATVPPGTTLPGGSLAPSPSDNATVGRGSGVNPANPQDMLNRSNPQDLTNPQARNPNDTSSGNTGTPQIMVPER